MENHNHRSRRTSRQASSNDARPDTVNATPATPALATKTSGLPRERNPDQTIKPRIVITGCMRPPEDLAMRAQQRAGPALRFSR